MAGWLAGFKQPNNTNKWALADTATLTQIDNNTNKQTYKRKMNIKTRAYRHTHTYQYETKVNKVLHQILSAINTRPGCTSTFAQTHAHTHTLLHIFMKQHRRCKKVEQWAKMKVNNTCSYLVAKWRKFYCVFVILYSAYT